MPLDLPAIWVSDVSVPLSAADLNQLRDMAILLDGLCYRRMNVTNSSGPQFDGDAADWHSAGDYRQSWWGLRLTTGMTTVTILGACATQIDIYFNGVLNTTQATSASFTKNITLGAFTNGDILLVEIRTNGNPASTPNVTSNYTGKYIIWDIYGSPVVTPSSWPGVPSFSGTYSAALLNQLRDACQYIWERVVAIPILPNVAHIYSPTTHKVETHKVFHGAIGRYASNEILRITGSLICKNAAEHYEVYVNGSLVLTSSTYGFQTVAFSHPITLSHTLGTRVELEIRDVVTSSPANPPQNQSLYIINVMRSEADSSGYASASPPTAFTAEESITAATLNSRLNSIATMLSDAKARLDARPELWNRARAFRRVYAKDDTQVARNFRRHSAIFQRQGDTVIVRGKAVTIAWGLLTVEPPGDTNGIPNPVNYAKFKWANEQKIGVNDDKIETNVVPLDSLPGLAPGMLYYVFADPGSGSAEFAAEFLADPTL